MSSTFKSRAARVRRTGDAIFQAAGAPMFLAICEADQHQTGRMDLGWLGPWLEIITQVGDSEAPATAVNSVIYLLTAHPKWRGEFFTPCAAGLANLKDLVPGGGAKYRDFGVGVAGLRDDGLNKFFAIIFLRMMYRPALKLQQIELWAPGTKKYEWLKRRNRKRFPGRTWKSQDGEIERVHIFSQEMGLTVTSTLDPVYRRSPAALHGQIGLALHFASPRPEEDLKHSVGRMGNHLPEKLNPDSFEEIHWVQGEDGLVGLRIDLPRKFSYLRKSTKPK